jgi:putative sigma-54 modulation protein
VQITVSARHTHVADADRELIVEKISRLGGKFLEMDRAEVHFFEERNPRIHDKEVCEITLEGHGHHVRCKSTGPDHLTAVDRAIEKLENKLHKLKTKLSTYRTHRDVTRAKLRAASSTELPEIEILEPVSVGAEPLNEAESALVSSVRIVKTKTVERMTLSPLDAALRMDLMEHGFYFFTNLETGRPAVLYRRADGDFGLIDESD